MGIAVKILHKYHVCCVGNETNSIRPSFPFPMQHLWYLFQISLLPMLLHVSQRNSEESILIFIELTETMIE